MPAQSELASPASARTSRFAAFAAFGLLAATASTWVHYQILNDPTYASFCDVNATFNCTDAYTSRFGAFGGVPVALLGVLFFAGTLVLIALCSRSAAVQNLSDYVFVLSTVGLAVVLYLAYASYVVLHVVCLLCAGTYVAVIGLFLTSGATTRYSMTSLPMRIMNDLRLLVRSPRGLMTAVAFSVVAIGAVLIFPEQHVSAASGVVGEQAAATPPAVINPEQLKQIEAYLAAQPRIPLVAPSDGAAVVIVKFNDYQCPGCGQTYRDYKAVLAKYAQQMPGKIKFITKDYPLERQCNAFIPQDLHSGACEAAVAVRLAREKGKGEAMEDWLYSNQPAMNPETVKKAAETVGGITAKEFDSRFEATLELVKADVAQGAQLKVNGTPTFFVNGMRLQGFRPEVFDAILAWELRRVQAAK